MGGSQSHPGLTEELLEDYTTLTYLSKGEILYLMKKFSSIDSNKWKEDFHHRFTKEQIVNKFDVLKTNPFQDRLFRVFSSKQDDCFSFEDMLDLCSAMSADCPPNVKAAWAFKVYDLDEDNQISVKDINEIVDRLIWCPNNPLIRINIEEKKKITKTILAEMNFDKNGSIGSTEFEIIMSRIPEFGTSFYFRL